MAWKAHVDVRLATLVLLLQVAVVLLTLGIAGGLVAVLSHERIAAEYGTRALDVANSVIKSSATAPASMTRSRTRQAALEPTLKYEHRRIHCGNESPNSQ